MKNILKRLGFWLLLPVSAAQGLRLRRTAVRLPEATGVRSGVSGQGEILQLLALGDSIIAGVGTGTIDQSLPVQFASALAEVRMCSVHWAIKGANGADISDLRNSINQLNSGQQADGLQESVAVFNGYGNRDVGRSPCRRHPS